MRLSLLGLVALTHLAACGATPTPSASCGPGPSAALDARRAQARAHLRANDFAHASAAWRAVATGAEACGEGCGPWASATAAATIGYARDELRAAFTGYQACVARQPAHTPTADERAALAVAAAILGEPAPWRAPAPLHALLATHAQR